MEDADFLSGLGGKDPQIVVGEDWSEALGLVEGPICVVPEDNDVTLGAMWIVASIAFHP